MKRKMASLILTTLLMSVPAIPVFADSNFTDVPSDSLYAKYILDLKTKGISNGMGDGTFAPSHSLTRAEFAKFLVVAFGMNQTNSATPFADIDGHWAKGYIQTAYSTGIVKGTSDTTFEPDSYVKREEAATMIWRYLSSHNVNATVSAITTTESTDDWATTAVQNIIAYNLYGPEVHKSNDGSWSYNSKELMTRQEMAALIDLATQLVSFGTSITISGHSGSLQTPVTAQKGTTMIITYQGKPSRTTQITDLLNPTNSPANLIADEASKTSKIGNIPLLKVKNDGDPKNDAFMENYNNQINTASKLFAQVTVTSDNSGNVTLQLPSVSGTGLVWKYLDFHNGSTPTAVVVTGNSVTFPDMNTTQNSFTLNLDTDPSPSNIIYPAGWLTIKNTSKDNSMNLVAVYSTLDIN